MPKNDEPPACTLVAIARNERRYIVEWIAYHLSVGFAAIVVYDNGSTDGTADVVSDVVRRDSRVSLVPWPTAVTWPVEQWESPQCAAYTDAVGKATTPWVAFFDIDEFIVPFRDRSISAYLATVPEDVSSIHVNWRSFGSSGRETDDYPFVTEAFTRCAEAHWGNHQHFKTIARRERIKAALIHYCITDGGRRTLTDGQDVDAESVGIAHAIAYDGIQLNHYQSKTWPEFERRMKLGDAFYPDGHPNKSRESSAVARYAALDRNEVEDLSIQSFLPAMHKQLVRLGDERRPTRNAPSAGWRQDSVRRLLGRLGFKA